MSFVNANQSLDKMISRTKILRARNLATLTLLLLVAACSSTPKQSTLSIKTPDRSVNPIDLQGSNDGMIANLLKAEGIADETGRKILVTGRVMTIEKREIVRGSCWDYTNTVYNRSGYPNDKASRIIVFKGTKSKGPYADAKLIKPGDWLFYVNHSYNGIEHSAIFVNWVNFDSRNAMMLSYGGEKRNEPARYLTYDLSNVYQIIRPAAKSN